MDHKKRMDDFYSGKMSPQQAQEFLEWLESPEAEEFLSAEIIQLWSEKLKSQDYAWDNSPLWHKINAEKSGFSKPYVNKSQPPKENVSIWSWAKYAAALVLIGVSAYAYFSTQQRPTNNPVTEALSSSQWITKTNPSGQKTKILLSDGSTIFLNSASSVSYPEDFQTNRKVTLEGEAFFEVAKDPEHPFSVESKGITTTALGTSFNISTFNRQDKVAVTLITGKVKLQQLGSTQEIELNPGEESVLAVDEANPKKYAVNIRDRILWTEGVLRFQNNTFTDVIEILQRWYGVTVQVTGQPSKDLATGTFDNNESLRNVLHVLSESMNFTYQLNEKQVLIHFN
ncbi:MAG: FecR family protein [Algoriphagus aquaeductus]|uniref:FecR family protein n=1 Tax=Algoriphagus aquaeductus TaxID=475299 RepID=UPI00391D4AA8